MSEAPAEFLDTAAVHSEVIDAAPRSGPDVDHPLLAAEQELEVVHEAGPAPADRVEIVIRRVGEVRSRNVRHQALQAGEGGVRIV